MNDAEDDQAASAPSPSPSPSHESPNNRLSRALSRVGPVEDDLTIVFDAAERRRIQNRVTQRNYSTNLRRRLNDLEHRRSISASSQDSPGHTSQPSHTQANIEFLALDCNSQLQSLLDMVQTSENEPDQASPADLRQLLEDELGRFRVWAANLGAFQDPKSPRSLDYRLRDGPVMRSNVVSGLERLKDSSIRVGEIITGKRPNRSAPAAVDAGASEDSLESAAERTTELEQLLNILHSSISHLFSLSILIRRLRPKGRLPIVDSLDSFDSSADVTYVEDKFPKARQVPWLAQRMGDAISRRRELIRYRQQHRAKISKAPEEFTNLNVDTETIATSYKEDDAVPFSPSNEPDVASVYTSATSFMTSTMDSEGTGLNIPDLSDMVLDGVQLNYGEPIECPYCRTIQNVGNRYEWKKHVFADLQPYVCIFKDCSLKLFETRHEWFEHETTFHQRHWRCTLCPGSEASYATEEDIAAHIESDHRGNVTESQLPLLLEACEQQSQTLDTSSCPFCQEWKEDTFLADNSRGFCRHIARHLRLLSLVSIPLGIEGLEIRSSMPDEVNDSSADEPSDKGSLNGDGDAFEEAASKWTMDAVQQWLRQNGFSQDWQQTLRELNIQRSLFLILGADLDHMGDATMHTLVFPKLSEICIKNAIKNGTSWDQSREHDEGRRLQRLIRSIADRPSQASYKTEQPPVGEDEIHETQEGVPPIAQMSRAERYENEKTRIRSSCFSKKAPEGQLIESYITHTRVVEYASSPGAPPPGKTVESDKKYRVLTITVRQSGRVRMHKMRENANGSFSVGKTWNFEDLNAVENQPGALNSLGVTVRLAKAYYWEMPSIKEKQFFIACCLKIYQKYTGGRFPRLVGYRPEEEDKLLTSQKAEYKKWLESRLPEGEEALGPGDVGQRRSVSETHVPFLGNV
ncbi:hypothetical protein QQX98_001270 [Neonectria punicea]|uniref:Uncharacterized protein n=1 Tax=Neonectria punicea TaxID=979145 RepID=A0ABR1HP15_9HYPO